MALWTFFSVAFLLSHLTEPIRMEPLKMRTRYKATFLGLFVAIVFVLGETTVQRLTAARGTTPSSSSSSPSSSSPPLPSQTLENTTAFSALNERILFSSEGKVQARLIGGHQANPAAYPYYVRLEIDGKLHCGGTLIHHEWVLTAGHCAHERVKVVLPRFRRDRMIQFQYSIDVVETIVHPDFRGLVNDFCVLRLSKAIYGIPFAPLSDSMVDPGRVVTAVGMGTMRAGVMDLPNELQEVQVVVISNEECSDAYKETGYEITDAMHCALGGGQQDSCRGDSGGPLLDILGNQIGIVSWGIGCALRQYPGVYASVPFAKPWIEKVTCLPEVTRTLPQWCTGNPLSKGNTITRVRGSRTRRRRFQYPVTIPTTYVIGTTSQQGQEGMNNEQQTGVNSNPRDPGKEKNRLWWE